MLPKLLLTGASSGVGLSLAQHLSHRFHVIAAARRLHRLEEVFSDNPNVSAYALDVADADGVEDALDRIVAEHGPILHLINNAGIMVKEPIENLETTHLTYSLQVNALGPAQIMRRLLAPMREQNFGRIINVTSGAPLNCSPGVAAYSASKAALNALTVTAAKEHADANIKINLMSPGPCRTEMAPDGPMEPEVCHPTADYLLNLDAEGPTGGFFWLGYEVPLFPDLAGVQWLEGIGNEKLRKVL